MSLRCKLGKHIYDESPLEGRDEFISFLKEQIRKEHGFNDVDIIKIKICIICKKPVVTFKFLNNEYEKTW